MRLSWSRPWTTLLSCATLVAMMSTAVRAAGTDESVAYKPVTIPLAVRGPYLGTYLQGRQHKNLAHMSPNFWTGSPLGWGGLLRVDGKVWNWMGELTEWPEAHNYSLVTDSYSSTFTFTNAGAGHSPSILLTASFISPITPEDADRQSLPFSYLSLSVQSIDEMPHKVEIYTDVNGLWTSDTISEKIEWEAGKHKSYTSATFKLSNQRKFQEEDDRALWGEMWYAAKSTPSVETTYSAGHDISSTRAFFAENGKLDNTVNTTFRAIRTKSSAGTKLDEPVFALAHSFGTVSPRTPAKASTVLLAIGHVRDPINNYMTSNDTSVDMSPLWRRNHRSTADALEFFLNDFDNAVKMSKKFNSKLYEDARRVHSKNYADVLAVSTRQIFMALETVWDQFPSTKSRYRPLPMTMLKEISSNGNCQTVDVIAPMLPFLVYASPQMLVALMEPIYRYISTDQYYPIPPPHDMGEHYPNITGRNDFLYPGMPLEESGNMLNMALAAIQISAEGQDQAEMYYPILKKWADWTVENTLYPGTQRSTDDFFPEATNTTSLAIKGIVGIQSMAEIAKKLGKYDHYQHYSSVATSYRDQFLTLGISTDFTHILGSYGTNQSSWATEYNIYYDKLLDTNLFPQWVYEMQDKWYLGHDEGYGPMLDSRMPSRSKTDWLAWTAGSSRSRDAQDMFINGLDRYLRHDENEVFGDLITPQEGWSVGYLTRPVVGGHFALVALDAIEERKKSRKGWHIPFVPALPSFDGVSQRVAEAKDRASDHPVTSFSTLVIFVGVTVFALRFRGRRRRRGNSRSPVMYMPLDAIGSGGR